MSDIEARFQEYGFIFWTPNDEFWHGLMAMAGEAEKNCTAENRKNWRLADGSYKHWMNPHTRSPFEEIVSCIMGPVAKLLKRPTVDHSKISYKLAGKDHFWHPHQDAGYKKRGWRGLTVAVHLDDVGVDNGPIMVWPGSHKDGLRQHIRAAGPDLISQARVIHQPAGIAQSTHGPAGTILIMDGFLVHASEPNLGSGSRRIFLIEFRERKWWQW